MIKSLGRRSGGIPCAERRPGSFASVEPVPRMVVTPRLEARITMGEMLDSSARLRYVKHSMSSIWTCSMVSVGQLHVKQIGAYLVNEEHTRNKLSNALVDIPVDDLVDLAP